MRTGKDIDACIDSLRFKLLRPLRISGLRAPIGRWSALDIIQLTADNGRVELRVDRGDQAPFRDSSAFAAARGPPATLVSRSAARSPRACCQMPREWSRFDPRSGRAVAALSDLVFGESAHGSARASIRPGNSGGSHVSLVSLKGRLVIIDFWATWCAPCWKTLAETEKISAWGVEQWTANLCVRPQYDGTVSNCRRTQGEDRRVLQGPEADAANAPRSGR